MFVKLCRICNFSFRTDLRRYKRYVMDFSMPVCSLKREFGLDWAKTSSCRPMSVSSTYLWPSVPWSVPNATDSGTRNPLIITSLFIGLATYAIAFNLNNLADSFSRVCLDRRNNLVERMQRDSSEPWRELAGKFEESRPENDRKMPSDWWIVVCQARLLFKRRKNGENV